MLDMNAVPVIALDHPAALDVARVGRKAAALAAARAAGLPVRRGVVLTSDWNDDDRDTALAVWRIISQDGALPLVVRRSPIRRDQRPMEDTPGAGAARIVTDGTSLLAALAASRRRGDGAPVLVHPVVCGPWHGELLADSSRRRRPVVVAHRAGSPDWVAELDAAGRVRDVFSAAWPDQPLDHPPVEVLARIVRLAARVDETFGGAHDLEWVVDDTGRPHLLRFRPVADLDAGGAPAKSDEPADDEPRAMVAAA